MVKLSSCFLAGIMQLRNRATSILDNKKGEIDERDEDKQTTLGLLQTVLSAEIFCVLRYTALAVSEHALENPWHGKAFLAQADDERRHMVLVADKIRQLGGSPDFSISRPAIFAELSGYSHDVSYLLEESLLAERVLIDHYRELIGYFSSCDPATSAMLQDIAQDEEYHINDMQDFCAISGV